MILRSENRSVKALHVNRWLISFALGVSIQFVVPNCALGEKASKAGQPSQNSSRATVSSASASRTANVKPAAKPDAPPRESGGLISIERMNELTGFLPASEAEVKELVAKIQAAVKAKDATAIEACFDEEQMVTRMIVGAKLSPLQRSELIRGFRASSSCSLMARLAVKSDSDFQCIRFVRQGTELRPLCRMISADEFVAYNEFLIQTDVGEGAKVVDILASSCDEYVCVTMRPFSLGPYFSHQSPETIPGTGIEEAIIESADGLLKYLMSIIHGDINGAISGLEMVKPQLAERPGMLVMKKAISKPLGLSEYRKAVLHLVERYPRTVGSDLALLELYQMEQKPIEMLTVADRLMKSLEDPWLNAYRIEGLVSQNRIKEAREAIAAAKAAVPNISDPYVDELGMLMKLKNHQETAQAIETLETKFGDKVVKLTEFPEFNEFSDSEVGRHFLAKRAGFDF